MTDLAAISAVEAVSLAANSIGNQTQANTPSAHAAASPGDIHAFEQSIAKVTLQPPAGVVDATGMNHTLQAMVAPLQYIDAEATDISGYAKANIESGADLTPSEIIQLTAKSQEFMFHCQLTSNIANRTSDGLQQLFRQQS